MSTSVSVAWKIYKVGIRVIIKYIVIYKIGVRFEI